MRKTILTLMALVAAGGAYADEYPYLSFETSDGSLESFSVESLSMTFSGDKLIAENKDGSRELDVADLGRMFFSSTPTGIADVSAEQASDRREVYTLSGIHVGSFDSGSDLRAALKSGMYVVKDNNNTTKIMVR